MKLLITCPPMLNRIEEFKPILATKGFSLILPEVVQTLSEEQLLSMIPNCDGWIAGDDPATFEVLSAGKAGRLKALVKWGVGIDNIDTNAISQLEIPFSNTPNMFGNEVADIAMGYVIGLARLTFLIDRKVRSGEWPKPCGISLKNKRVGLVGYGDIGKQSALRLLAAKMTVTVYDPIINKSDLGIEGSIEPWPNKVEECDFIIFTCSLNKNNYHMFNKDILDSCKNGVRIINVSRGQLIDEDTLLEGLSNGHIHSCALDVLETEPLPINSLLRDFEQCIFGSHNASNTEEAVRQTSLESIKLICQFLGIE